MNTNCVITQASIPVGLEIDFFDKLFKKHGFEIRLCGGAVRDYLLGIMPTDIDFCTNATPDDMFKMAYEESHYFVRIISTGLSHGTLTFVTPTGNFEITTLRKDLETDGRHAVVQFTDSWQDDAARRDFTMNAMMMDAAGNVYDWFNGRSDLRQGIVRFVGNADKRIDEDALRMVRFCRFSSRFAREYPEHDGTEALKRKKQLIKNVSPERVWKEIRAAAKNGPEKFRRFVWMMEDLLKEMGITLSERSLYDCFGLGSKYLTKFPTFAMAAYMNKEETAYFFEKFKLSTVERLEMFFFSKHKANPFTKESAEDAVVDGVNKEWVAATLEFQMNHDLANYILSWEVPIFPVSGQDLLDVGVKPGPKMGSLLRDLKNEWIASRFTLTEEELIATINL